MNRFLACLLVVSLGAPLQAQTLRAIRVAQNISRPTDLASPPGDLSRQFVVEGRLGIRIIKDGVLLPTPFLDISSELTNNQAIGSLAFHPDYANNGRFFLLYVDKNLLAHVAEYHVSADPDVADPASRVQILGPWQQNTLVHLWNCLQFGPDGKLYVGIGDDIWTYDYVPNYSQDLTTLLGKILRIDVDIPPPYIPPDNPFVGQPGVREEIWMWGLRQPWRFSFDSQTGDVYISDVGSNDHEELDFVSGAVASGQNFGWRCLEAFTCNDFAGCAACTDPLFTPPIYEYSHDEDRCAVIGGYVYRGLAIPWLRGAYFFADYCSGRIWSFRYDGQTMSDFQERTEDLVPYPGEGEIGLISSFGVDAEGELYILDNQSGEVFKIVEDVCEVSNYCVISQNSAGNGATIGSTGTPHIDADDFELTVAGAAPNKYGVFFYGKEQDLVPFGDGVRCVKQPFYRLKPLVHTDAQGAASYHLDFQDPPQSEARILPGSTWNFQFWFRDPAFGGTGFNTTDGLNAIFCP
jgi:glucose/arabinose dehydrogenase